MNNWNKYFRQIRKTKTRGPAIATHRGLTKGRKLAYLKQLGTVCPHCGSDSLIRVQGDTWGQEPERVSVRVDCAECKRAWVDVYTLTDMVEVAR